MQRIAARPSSSSLVSVTLGGSGSPSVERSGIGRKPVSTPGGIAKVPSSRRSPQPGGVTKAPITFMSVGLGPLLWNVEDGYFPNPLTEDITAWYVTNNSGHVANIDIALLVDTAKPEPEPMIELPRKE